MSSQSILGFVFLVVGVILLIVGVNASHSVSDQVSNSVNGRYTHDTLWFIIGGIALGLTGLLTLAFGYRGRNA
jgi:hypothetical protein